MSGARDSLSEFDFDLPEDRIAQEPAARRDEARLLVLHRDRRSWEHRGFRDIAEYLREGDILVLNETKVFPARLRARRPGGGTAEILLVEPLEGETAWVALAWPARSFRAGSRLTLEASPVTVHPLRREGAAVVVQLRLGDSPLSREDVLELCNGIGEIPLPPYVRREADDPRTPMDRERYQTVFARNAGAVAAPTAGLHFTPEILDALQRDGVTVASLTLHVGPGTFRPLTETTFRATKLHAEWVEIGTETASAVLSARGAGRRVVAVGTTSLRAVESLFASGEVPFRRSTELFIKPGYEFLGVDMLVTNFHLPRTSLLLLVCAFAGREFVLEAYREAIREGYRFTSYGDAMLIL